MKVQVIILAAGQGSRMKSNKPKVLHELAGKPMLKRVIDTTQALGVDKTFVVIGHGAKQVRNAFPEVTGWVEQTQQLGTGHAVMQALPGIAEDAVCLILYGDVPLITGTTLSRLLEQVTPDTLGLLTVTLENPTGYGRIVRDENQRVVAIVEQKDATPEQRLIREVNTGIMAVNANHLKTWLPRLSNDNAQGEYYLTDIIEMAVQDGVQVSVSQPLNEQEVQGVNDRQQLADLERWYQTQQAIRLMKEGVTIADPGRIDIRGDLSVGTDVFIDVNCVFEGQVEIAANVSIGPNCVIRNSRIGENTRISANSVIEDAVIHETVSVGPFARIRPGTVLKRASKVGNFVETKKAIVGEGSKINHLSYVGDAELGDEVNVGAGTITCNYDGVNKFKTTIGHQVFIGSNSSLVAPVHIADGATIGAGSTITKDVNNHQLAIARGQQRNIDGWKRPSKKD